MEIAAPFGLPAVPRPAGNPPTAEAIELGRRLFFEPALSADGTISCASCHRPEHGFADPRALSKGVGGQDGPRNTPTVLNGVYFERQFHDGRADSLEEQVEGPVTSPVEMAQTRAGAVARIGAAGDYQTGFERAFGPGPVTFEKIAMAIASFERTLVSGDSPFDRFYFGRDPAALSEEARRGWEVFRLPEKGDCAVCHLVGARAALFTDNLFHNLGVGLDAGGDLTDLGRSNVTGRDADRGAFKTPSLRNVALTAPYMHDGSLKTLREVIDFYAVGGRPNPSLDPEIKPLLLSEQDRRDLEAFLESLTGTMPAGATPSR